MRFEVLGPLRVRSDDEELSLGEPQPQKLLALLLAAPEHTLTTDRLIDEMWGTDPPPSARHLVQVYISRLRTVFRAAEVGERIPREGSAYRLRVGPEELDAEGFTATVDEARLVRAEDPRAAARWLQKGLAAWRGRPYAELGDETPALRAEADRLEELHLSALEELVAIELDLGRHAELTGRLEGLTSEHAYRERLWEQRMLALYRCGRQAEALQAYHDLRRLLSDDLGIDPGPGIAALERRILLHDPELLWEPPAPPSNVPSAVSSFVGRRQELDEVAQLLESARLVTLTGPGGIGKTRLAAELADGILSRFPDGIWWVDLAQIDDPGMVPAAVAEALGVQAQPQTSVTDSVVRALLRRTSLLVLDNCEHLASAAAELVAAVLRDTPRVQVLTTSRSSLHVPGEVLWVVPPLGMPAESTDDPSALELSDAVRLFAERGAAVDTAFRLDTAIAPVVADICRQLDGLPLAIEMAAVHVRALSPAQLADALSDRFALLRQTGLDPRHDTLETALDWGYELLQPGHRELFDRLSVVAGPFDLAAVVAIGGSEPDVARDAVATLVDASMISAVRPAADAVHYRLLETMREYGLRRLRIGEAEEAARAAHADHYLGLVEHVRDSVGTGDFTTTTERLRRVYPDLRQALGWSLEHQPRARALGLAEPLFHYWFSTGNGREAGYWGERMLEGAGQEPAALRAAGHNLVAFSANLRGDPEAAVAHSDLSVELCRKSGDRHGLADALFGRGNVALLVGDLEQAAEAAQEGLALSDESGDRWHRAGALSTLGFIHSVRGEFDETRRCWEEGAAIYRDLGDIAGQVVMCPVVAVALIQGDLLAAESLARQAVVAAMRTAWEGAALVTVAQVLLARGDVDAAERVARLGMTRALDAGVELWFRRALIALAQVHAARGDAERAAVLLGASERNAFATEFDPNVIPRIEERCRAGLGDQAFGLARGRGHELEHARIIDLVFEAAEPEVWRSLS